MYAALLVADGGVDLESFEVRSVPEARSILLQVGTAGHCLDMNLESDNFQTDQPICLMYVFCGSLVKNNSDMPSTFFTPPALSISQSETRSRAAGDGLTRLPCPSR